MGGRADLAVVRLARESVTLGDSRGELVTHDERLVVDATVLAGRRLHADPNARPQGRRKPGLPPVDARLTRPPA